MLPLQHQTPAQFAARLVARFKASNEEFLKDVTHG